MNDHIASGCVSGVAKKTSSGASKCGVARCTVRVLVPMICSKCTQQFCVKHRYETDHSCKGVAGRSASPVAAAAQSRQQQQYHAAPASGASVRPVSTSTAVPEVPAAQPNIFANLFGGTGYAQPQSATSAAAAPTSVDQEERMLAEAIERSMQDLSQPKQAAQSCSLQ